LWERVATRLARRGEGALRATKKRPLTPTLSHARRGIAIGEKIGHRRHDDTADRRNIVVERISRAGEGEPINPSTSK
jgi:hypothetical protein